ncbi:MAG: anthranilate phosphoribosyltransferase [Candidatus Aquicultorales bacterium]
MLVEAIRATVEKKDLTLEEATAVMEEIMTGQATDAQIAAFITALRIKGETVEEISGFASVMRKHALPVRAKAVSLVDTCGTGGDAPNTFNISTTSAFVVAGAGVPVAKHGNRSVSSQSGSADVLEALGIKIDLTPEMVADCIDAVGIGFLFAPAFHQAMKYAIGPRRQIGIRTVFNVLGPLTNPAGADHQVVGVYDKDLTEVLAKVLGNLGLKHALVVHGDDGTDEISIAGETTVSEMKDGTVVTYKISPEMFGLTRASLEDIAGGSADENAKALRAILEGETGARRDVVLLNAGAALLAADKAETLTDGIALAARSIDSGAALEKLRHLTEFSQA